MRSYLEKTPDFDLGTLRDGDLIYSLSSELKGLLTLTIKVLYLLLHSKFPSFIF